LASEKACECHSEALSVKIAGEVEQKCLDQNDSSRAVERFSPANRDRRAMDATVGALDDSCEDTLRYDRLEGHRHVRCRVAELTAAVVALDHDALEPERKSGVRAIRITTGNRELAGSGHRLIIVSRSI
jgi:hypothetical protein